MIMIHDIYGKQGVFSVNLIENRFLNPAVVLRFGLFLTFMIS